MTSLKQKTVSGVKWQVINKISQKVISVATFAVLARILEPSVFGLFAMSFILIDGFHVFKSFGLDTALIHRKDRVEEAANTAFFIIQASGIVMFICCFFAAPVIGYFFHKPEVVSIIRALGVVFILTCFSKIPLTLLAKQMRFDLISITEILGSVANSVFVILFAFISQSVWSLVFAYLIKQLTITISNWYFSGYKFKWQFDMKLASELLHYGKFMIGLSFLWYVSANINNIIVGKILGTIALGYYALASNIGNLINTHFVYMVEGVMFPAYSSVQHDSSEVKRIYLKTTKFVSLLTLPISVAMILLSREFVLTIYGTKWLSIVSLIQLYGLVQLFVPILVCSGSVFLGCGKPQYNYKLNFYGLILGTPIVIFLTYQWGLIGTVVGGFITSLLIAPVNVFLVRKLITFRIGEFLRNFLPSIYGSLVMLVIVLVLKAMVFFYYPPHESFVRNAVLLTGFSFVAVISYSFSIFLIDRPIALEVKELLSKQMRLKNEK